METFNETLDRMLEHRPSSCNTTTAGKHGEESASVAELEVLLRPYGKYFRHYPEVTGQYMQPKLGAAKSSCRIDKIIVPSQELIDAGWTHGPFGIECKKSNKKIGPVIAQCQDYKNAAFCLSPGFHVVLEWIFIWPLEKQFGDIASVMAQSRIGYVNKTYREVLFFGTDSKRLISFDGQVYASSTQVGKRMGSR